MREIKRHSSSIGAIAKGCYDWTGLEAFDDNTAHRNSPCRPLHQFLYDLAASMKFSLGAHGRRRPGLPRRLRDPTDLLDLLHRPVIAFLVVAAHLAPPPVLIGILFG